MFGLGAAGFDPSMLSGITGAAGAASTPNVIGGKNMPGMGFAQMALGSGQGGGMGFIDMLKGMLGQGGQQSDQSQPGSVSSNSTAGAPSSMPGAQPVSNGNPMQRFSQGVNTAMQPQAPFAWSHGGPQVQNPFMVG